MFQGNPIVWKDLIDFSDNKDVKSAIADIQALEGAYKDFNSTVTSGFNNNLNQLYSNVSAGVRELVASSKELNITNRDQQQSLLQINATLEKYAEILTTVNDRKKKVNDGDKALADSIDGLSQKLKQQIDEFNSLGSTTNDQKNKLKGLATQIKDTKAQISDLTDLLKTQKEKTVYVSDSINGLQEKLKQLQGVYNNLSKTANADDMKALAEQIKRTRIEIEQLQNSTKVSNVKPIGLSDAIPSPDSINGLKASLASLQEEYNNLSISSSDYDIKSKQLIEDIRVTQTEINNLTNATKLTTQTIEFAAGSYNALDAETKQLTKELLGLEGGMEENNIRAKELQTLIQANTEKLKAFDATIGNHKRSVGNYAIATYSLSQVLREFPAFTYSIQTGFLALSNNIPILIDDFKKLATQLGSNQAAFIAMGESLFSFTNLVTIGITIITIFGSKLFDSAKEADNAKSKYDQLTASFNSYLDALKDRREFYNDDANKGEKQAKRELDLANAQSDGSIAALAKIDAARKKYDDARSQSIKQQLSDLDELQSFYNENRSLFEAGRTTQLNDAATSNIRKILPDLQKALKEGFSIDDFINARSAKLQETLKDIESDKKVADAQEKVRADQREKKDDEELQKRLRNAQKLIEATEKYEIEKAKLQYANSQKTVDNEIALERAIYEIKKDSIEKQMKLYGVGTEQYVKLQAEEVQITAEKTDKINKIIEDNAKKQQRRRDELDKVLKARRDAQAGVKQAQGQSNFIGQSAEIDLSLANASGNLFFGRNDEFAAYEAHQRLQQRALQDAVDIRQAELDDMRLKLGEAANLDKDYLNKKKEVIDAENELKRASAEYGIAQAQREAQAKQALYKSFYDFASNALSSYTEIAGNNIEAQIDMLTKQHDYDIQLAGSNASLKSKIDADYNEKVRQEKTKESENQKMQAIFNAEINAAAAAIRALADYPYPYSLIIGGLALASGTAQAIAIGSKKVPQYWKGRKNGPKELARVNEKGFEIIEHNDGRMYIAGSGEDTIADLRQGDKVYTHEESIKKLENMTGKQNDALAYSKSLNTGIDVYAQDQEKQTNRVINAMSKNALSEYALARVMKKAMEGVTVEQSIIDEYGFRRLIIKHGQRNQILSNRNKMGGRD